MSAFRFRVTLTFLWILPPAWSSTYAFSMCQSLRLLGSLLLWNRLPTRVQAPTSMGGSTSGRVAGIASAEVGGFGAASTADGGATIGGGTGAGTAAGASAGAAGGASGGV